MTNYLETIEEAPYLVYVPDKDQFLRIYNDQLWGLTLDPKRRDAVSSFDHLWKRLNKAISAEDELMQYQGCWSKETNHRMLEQARDIVKTSILVPAKFNWLSKPKEIYWQNMVEFDG